MSHPEVPPFEMYVSGDCKRNKKEGKIETVTEIFSLDWVRLVLCNSLPQNFRAKNFAGCRHTLAVSVDNQDIKELMVILKEQELWEVVSATCVKA